MFKIGDKLTGANYSEGAVWATNNKAKINPKTWQIEEFTENEKAADARAERDRRIDAIRWRIERYQTQAAAGIETTDTAGQYKSILLYIQALRDVPKQAGFPDAIEWPEEPTGISETPADPVSEITGEETEQP